MKTLLAYAIEAHGGLALWNKIKAIGAEASITGAIWHIKSRPEVLKNVIFTANTRQEKITMTFPGEDKMTVFQPGLIAIKYHDENDFQYFDNPRSTFEGHKSDTPWQDVHVAYFSGEALWTYLTIPFLYTYPNFQSEEIEPWKENGETWRRLKVIFPEDIASHTREQISYFGPDGLLRRHDYTVDILGGATGANYASDYRDIAGLIIPATRKVFAFEGDGGSRKVISDPILVEIKMKTIHIES